jgi:hypothetical protein
MVTSWTAAADRTTDTDTRPEASVALVEATAKSTSGLSAPLATERPAGAATAGESARAESATVAAEKRMKDAIEVSTVKTRRR